MPAAVLCFSRFTGHNSTFNGLNRPVSRFRIQPHTLKNAHEAFGEAVDPRQPRLCAESDGGRRTGDRSGPGCQAGQQGRFVRGRSAERLHRPHAGRKPEGIRGGGDSRRPQPRCTQRTAQVQPEGAYASAQSAPAGRLRAAGSVVRCFAAFNRFLHRANVTVPPPPRPLLTYLFKKTQKPPGARWLECTIGGILHQSADCHDVQRQLLCGTKGLIVPAQCLCGLVGV